MRTMKREGRTSAVYFRPRTRGKKKEASEGERRTVKGWRRKKTDKKQDRKVTWKEVMKKG